MKIIFPDGYASVAKGEIIEVETCYGPFKKIIGIDFRTKSFVCSCCGFVEDYDQFICSKEPHGHPIE